MAITIFLILGMSLAALPAHGQKKTPSHVYQNTERLLREIVLLREAKSVTGAIREPGVQYNKLPLHVYAKGMEVREKISTLRQVSGLAALETERIPIRKITPGDVFSMVERLITELRPVKGNLGAGQKIAEPRFLDKKTPSDVYQNLWKASNAMDGLIPALTPGHVYRNALYIQADLKMIARALGQSLPEVKGDGATGRKITPKDVLVESFKNLYRVARLERKVGVPPFSPPGFPVGKITPSDPFDASSMLLAELVRVKLKLKVLTHYQLQPLPEGKTPGDVLVGMTFAGNYLDHLSGR